jgi:hypothetical protein
VLQRLVDKFNNPEKFAMVSCYVSIGLGALTCFYLFVVRDFIVDAERLGLSPRPRSDLMWVFIALVCVLTAGLVVLIKRQKQNIFFVKIIACLMLLFHCTMYVLMALYLLFYKAPDMIEHINV